MEQPCEDTVKIHERCLRFKPPPEILDGYLARSPLAHALFRASEINALRPFRVPGPVLDLGCGAGEFAALALENDIDVGIDLAEVPLPQARATRRYGCLLRADARRLPFADRQFRSVISVSVLEHIPEPAAVLAEVSRVLQPGGRLVGTVVLADLHQHLFYPRLLRALGLGSLARLYINWHDRCFRHRTMLTKMDWEGLLARSGLTVTESRQAVSPRVTRWWDCLLPPALPYRLLGRFGSALMWRPRWFRNWMSRVFDDILNCEEAGGSVLIFAARKPGRVAKLYRRHSPLREEILAYAD